MSIHGLYAKYTCMYLFCLECWKKKDGRKKTVNIEEMKQRRKTGRKDAGIVHIYQVVLLHGTFLMITIYIRIFHLPFFVFADRAKTANGSFIRPCLNDRLPLSPRWHFILPPSHRKLFPTLSFTPATTLLSPSHHSSFPQPPHSPFSSHHSLLFPSRHNYEDCTSIPISWQCGTKIMTCLMKNYLSESASVEQMYDIMSQYTQPLF